MYGYFDVKKSFSPLKKHDHTIFDMTFIFHVDLLKIALLKFIVTIFIQNVVSSPEWFFSRLGSRISHVERLDFLKVNPFVKGFAQC